MIVRGWVGPTIGLIVSMLLYFLLVPEVPGGPMNTLLSILLIVIAVVCAVLLVASFIRRP
jgi:hypothetical protein